MQKSLLFLFTYILLVNANEDYFSNRILFCLAQDHSPLKISFLNNTPVTDNKDINSILSEYDVVDLKKWLHTADENLIDGDIRLSNIYRLQFGKNKSYTELADIIIKLRSLNNIVIDARLEEKYHLTYQTKRHLPNDLRYNEQWALRKIGADYAWGLWDFRRNSVQDSSILIGLVDTGCDYDHPDLDEALFINFGEDINHDGKITTININGIDDDKNGFIDDFRGGEFAGKNTSSAGKHIHDDYAAQPYLENVIDGIIYCADMGADIINCSFSGPLYNPFSQAAINAVVNKYDCIIVCAAGNDNWNNDNIPQYPADYKNTLSVAALTNFDEKAGYSNYGNSVDISAPGGEGNSSGTGIISTVDSRLNEYDTWYGTSMATAMVTGSFALLEEWFPNKSSNWYIEQILNHSDNIDAQNTGFEGELGHGRVNVYT
ncbi:MAG: S8 family serine peptidase, partial [Calditrichaceae bacterium]